MSKHEEAVRDLIAGLDASIGAEAVKLAEFEAEAAKATERGTPFSRRYYRDQRAALVAKVAEADAKSRAEMGAWRTAALADARETRAKAEADRDPQLRIAEEMERARLVASTTNAETFAAQARQALDAKQPRRAALLLGAAMDKGWKGGIEIDPETGVPISTLSTLIADIEDGIDTAEPDRAEARSLELTIIAADRAFSATRTTVLARHGIGVRGDGSIGSAHPEDIARASLSAKLSAFRMAQEAGTGYEAPKGLNDSVPTGDYLSSYEGPVIPTGAES